MNADRFPRIQKTPVPDVGPQDITWLVEELLKARSLLFHAGYAREIHTGLWRKISELERAQGMST